MKITVKGDTKVYVGHTIDLKADSKELTFIGTKEKPSHISKDKTKKKAVR